MGLEKEVKEVSKGGGFFHLFDWTSKSRRKLFANKSDIPDGSKQGKTNDENLPVTRFHLVEDCEYEGISCNKGGSEYSCASSATDDDGSGIRAPSVVARLMGLDSLPTSSANEPYLAPFFESRSLHDSHYHRDADEFFTEYTSSNHQSYKIRNFCHAVEPRPPKLQNMPIERFQTEPLPPKSVRSVPLTHRKLLSPIKTPGFISPKSAAHIMEAAAKILEPGLQTRPRFPITGSSSAPSKDRDLKDGLSTCQQQLQIPEKSERPDESNAVKTLKEQHLNKSSNGSEAPQIFRASEQDDTRSLGCKSTGKSLSLAMQAKVNVQRREGLSSGNKISLSRLEKGECWSKGTIKKHQASTSKNLQKKPASSGVLKQNDLKQNHLTTRDKLPLKPSVSTQQGRKVLSGDSSLGRRKNVNKVPVNPKSGCRKEGLEISEPEKQPRSSSRKSLPQRNRAINGDAHKVKCRFPDATFVDMENRSGHSHVSTNGHKNYAEDFGRGGMDVVSFTFSSPLVKPRSGSDSSGQMSVKQENTCNAVSQGEKSEINVRTKGIPSIGLNVIGGDALSILLEQKLRELTSGFEFSCSGSVMGNATSSASFLPDLISAVNSVSNVHEEPEKKTLLPHNNQLVNEGNSKCLSTNVQLIHSNNPQGVGEMTEYNSNGGHKEYEYQQPSPVSILETSFSNDSCNSSESSDGINGCKQISSAETQYSEHCVQETTLMEAEAELSDSASSSFSGKIDKVPGISAGLVHVVPEKQELEYVRVILSRAKLLLQDFNSNHSCEIVDPSLFERLESELCGSRIDLDEEGQLRRKALFDCVGECLNLKYVKYMIGGYRTWAQGTMMLRSKRLAEEVYKEILGWRSMGYWMVNEVVDRDMSTGLGRWTLFEAEGFEIGVELEEQILSSMIEEVVASLRSPSGIHSL